MPVTSCAVENPASASTSAREPIRAAFASVSSETPRPSSATTISTEPPFWSARSSIRPASGLCASSRSAGASIPCATELRKKVNERVSEAFQDHTVELGVDPDDPQLGLLALGQRHVTYRARQRAGDRGERQRPHPDRRVLQLGQQAFAEIQLICDGLLGLVGEHVLEPAAMQDRLADEVQEPVDLLRRGRGSPRGGPSAGCRPPAPASPALRARVS